MPIDSRNTLKSYLQTGDKPTQTQFGNLVDSLFHLTEDRILIKVLYDPAREYKLGELAAFVQSSKLVGYIANKNLGAGLGFNSANWDPLVAGASSGVAAGAVSVTNVGYNNAQEIFDALLYENPQILSITNNVGTVEIGKTVDDLTIDWNRNKDVTQQEFDQGIGVISDSVTQLVLNSLGLTNTTNYTLTITDSESNTDQKTTTVLFSHKIYWGVDPNTSLTNAQILALSNEFKSNKLQERVLDASVGGGNNYLYFSWPVSYGKGKFFVGGFETSFQESIVSFTNASGHAENFYLYRSIVPQNGSAITVEVFNV